MRPIIGQDKEPLEKLHQRVAQLLNQTMHKLIDSGELGDDPLGTKALGRAVSAEASYIFMGREAAESFGDLKELLRAVPTFHISKLIEMVGWDSMKPWWQLEWFYRMGRLVDDWSMTWASDKDVRFSAQLLEPAEFVVHQFKQGDKDEEPTEEGGQEGEEGRQENEEDREEGG